jgi:hypothetical protein
VLRADTRRSIGNALAELLIYLGRAQPTLPRLMRAPFRYESGRVVVALRARRPSLMIFGAEHVAREDVNLFANIALSAGVNLWFVPQTRCRPATRAAFDRLGVTDISLRDALAAHLTSPTSRDRLTATPCEHALRLGSSTKPRCDAHAHAGECVTSSFADAVIAARVAPTAIRTRLYELTTLLSSDQKWHLYASARDPYLFAERAIGALDISSRGARDLQLRDLSPEGDVIRAGNRNVPIPAVHQAVLCLHRDIRLEEGSPLKSRLLMPHDDRNRRVWAALPARVSN